MKQFKYITYAILLLLFIRQYGMAQILQPAQPEQVGFSSERLNKMDKMLRSYTADHRIAGEGAIVVRHGKIVYYSASGYRDIKANIPLQKDDIYRLASQTKEITCVAVLMLYEEGKFLLDDPVSKYIPEFKNPRVLKTFNPKDSSYTTIPANREITIHDLLTHSSGISYRVIGTKETSAIYQKAGIPIGFEARHLKLADEMKILAKLPLVHQPGAATTYGLSIDVLGYLVEVVSGESLNDFFNERLFKPLGMKDTYFYVPLAKQARMPKVYKTNDKGETVENTADDTTGSINVYYPFTKNGTYYSGGGGLSSTAYDYTIFLQMLLNGGKYNGKQYLSPATIRLMTTDQSTFGGRGATWADSLFGYVFQVTTEKGATTAPWHKGSYSGAGFWGSAFWVDPTSDLIAMVWTQSPDAYWGELQNKFKVMVYSALVQ